MCLIRINKKFNANKRVVKAWKAFTSETKHGITSWLYGGPYRRGKWYSSVDPTFGYHKYEVGFHGFARKRDAVQFAGHYVSVILPVELRNIICVGDQRGKTYVAKQMRILKGAAHRG